MRDFVRARVMTVLRLDPEASPPRNARLMDLGFDSLMAIQLRDDLGRGLGMAQRLSATLLFDHPTIDAIAQHLLERLGLSTDSSPAAAASSEVPSRAAEIAAMSDAEIEALLLDPLGGA
jgi:hypothetical protein